MRRTTPVRDLTAEWIGISSEDMNLDGACAQIVYWRERFELVEGLLRIERDKNARLRGALLNAGKVAEAIDHVAASTERK